MSRIPLGVPLLLLLSVVTAGCLGGTGSQGTSKDAVPATVPASSDANMTLPGAADASESNKTLGAMPHIHDYWKGRERVTVLDQDVSVDPQTAVFWAAFSTYLQHTPSAGGAFVQLPAGQLVFEGTGQLDITLTYTDPAMTGLHFAYRHAGTDEFSKWVETPSGKTASIPITADMTDMPHSKESRWIWLFETANPYGAAIGKFHIKMDIVKMRDVRLFPAHPDFWHGATSLELVRASGTAKSSQTSPRFVERIVNPLQPPDGIIGEGRVVPMETKELVVNVTLKSVNPSTLTVDHLHLYVHTADSFESQFREVDNAKAIKTTDGKSWSWRIPVLMNQTDNPYAEKSAWDYYATAAYANPIPGAPPCEDGCYNAEMTYDIIVTAIKDDGVSGGT